MKTVLLGITGGIAAYKSAYVASGLKKKGYDVHVVMTENATEFISPLTFETLTNNRCSVDMFDRNFEYDVKHISLAKAADVVLIAPATANTIAKLAHGIADNMLTTTVLACTCPKIIVPAMNTAMYENPATQDNLDILRDYGFEVIEPAEGLLACGDEGKGKMPEPDALIACVEHAIGHEKDLLGKRLLVTAGPTQEAIDPVRYITNHSSGKMGYALAKMAALRGAEVTLVSGPVSLQPFAGVRKIDVVSAQDMFEAVTSRNAEQDIVIMCSAVADYKPAVYAAQKVKKSDADLHIDLTRTQDILGYLGEHKREGQVLVGFSMETENLLENSRAKLDKKNADLICANSIASAQTGFAVDTNKVTLITRQGVLELPLCSKEQTADLILDKICTF